MLSPAFFYFAGAVWEQLHFISVKDKEGRFANRPLYDCFCLYFRYCVILGAGSRRRCNLRWEQV